MSGKIKWELYKEYPNHNVWINVTSEAKWKMSFPKYENPNETGYMINQSPSSDILLKVFDESKQEKQLL